MKTVMSGIRTYIPLVILGVAVLFCGGLLMLVSQNVYHSQERVNNLSKEILQAEWEIRALNAELAFLTRPDRLEQLSLAMAKSISPEMGKVTMIAPADYLFPEADLAVTPIRKPASFKTAEPSREVAPQNVAYREEAQKPKKDFSRLLNDIGGGE
jgi:hypothetical protein